MCAVPVRRKTNRKRCSKYCWSVEATPDHHPRADHCTRFYIISGCSEMGRPMAISPSMLTVVTDSVTSLSRYGRWRNQATGMRTALCANGLRPRWM